MTLGLALASVGLAFMGLGVVLTLVALNGNVMLLVRAIEAQNTHYGIGVPPDHSDDPEPDGTAKFVCTGCGSRAPRRRSEHDRPLRDDERRRSTLEP